jgi:adenine-specific DNA-methyltransferase
LENTKLPGSSQDLVQKDMEQLSALFPDVVQDGRIDWGQLKLRLEESIADEEERYRFTWQGKSQAIRFAQEPSYGTLRPMPDKSRDWEHTQNLYIEGENLEVLKLLQKSYYGKVKMIYIDPPYNTGKEFIYDDDYRDPLGNYLRLTGQADEAGQALYAKPEKEGKRHSRWLNMIYPRLLLARMLLRDDGVIMINIDENESANLQKVTAEIFGENNDLGTIVWDKRNPKGDAKGISYQHEYILVYAKNINRFMKQNRPMRRKKNASRMLRQAADYFSRVGPDYPLEDANRDFAKWVAEQTDLTGGEKAYNRIDENGEVYQAVSMAWPNKRRAPEAYFEPLIHPVTGKPCPVPERGWRNPPATMRELAQSGRLLFGPDETTQPRRKYLLSENVDEIIPSLLYYGGSDDQLLRDLGIAFDSAKALAVVLEHILSFTKDGDLIMDFFSGSATCAHAVMQANAQEGTHRRFLLVQWPEQSKEITGSSGFPTISELGRARILRAGDMIKKDEEGDGVDIGFRMFALDSSNFLQWRPDAQHLEQYLENYVENFITGRSALDAAYELLLKLGYPLTARIEIKEWGGVPFFWVENGELLLCLSGGMTLSVADALVKGLAEEGNPRCRIAVRDANFASDCDKANVEELLCRAGVRELIRF